MAEVTSFSEEPLGFTSEEIEDSFDTWMDDIDPDINEGPRAIGYSYDQMRQAFKAGYKLMKYGAASYVGEEDEEEAEKPDSSLWTETMVNPDLDMSIENLKQLLRFGSSSDFLAGF